MGGTLTGFVLYDESSGACALHKRAHYAAGPGPGGDRGGGKALTAQRGMGMEHLTVLVHGTTLVTNGIIERRGARAGMLTTTGLSDVADSGTERRYDLFGLRLRFPVPLVPRRLCAAHVVPCFRGFGRMPAQRAWRCGCR